VIIAHEQSWASARSSRVASRLRSFLDRELIGRGADVFFAVSRADRRRMIDLEGISPGRIRVLPNAIPARRPSGRDVRVELGIPPGAPVVGTVCQLRPEKALDVLVAAAASLAQRYPDLRVLIVGDGREEGRLRELIRQQALEHNVLLTGTRTDVPDVLAAIDVAICCSHFEGTPLSVMEYMAAGKPVVASDVGGLPELIEHGVHGLLVEPGSPASLAEAVSCLLDNAELRAAMGNRGSERQFHEFDLGNAVRRLEGLYEDLYRDTPRGRREGWMPPPRSRIAT
jgi:glycosyltransferase involved in cell wall biosynthesis